VGLTRLDRGAKSRPLGEKVTLADQLVQRARAHADRQRRLGGRDVPGHLRVIGLIEQAVVHPHRL